MSTDTLGVNCVCMIEYCGSVCIYVLLGVVIDKREI